MARKLHIVLIVFCLGVFVLPKQNVFAQAFQQTCCSTADSKDCCPAEKEDQKPCHEKEKTSCGGDCTSCKSCTTTTVFTGGASILTLAENEQFLPTSSMKFCYLTPDFSDPTAKIWQPPKIG